MLIILIDISNCPIDSKGSASNGNNSYSLCKPSLSKMWHGFSRKFHVTSCDKSTAAWSKSTPNSMTIPCHLSRYYLFSMLEHDMDFGRQGQVMEFPWHLPRKWWDFRRIWPHFGTKPNCRQKDMRKSMSHFLQGYYNL